MKIKNLDDNIIEYKIQADEPEFDDDEIEDMGTDETLYIVSFALEIEVSGTPKIEISKHPEMYLFEYSQDIPKTTGTLDVNGSMKIRADSEEEAAEIVRGALNQDGFWELSKGYMRGIKIKYIDAEKDV